MKTKLHAATLLERMLRAAYAEHRGTGLPALQWTILRYLDTSEQEGRSLAAVAEHVGVTPAPASRAVQTLERRGLVTKRRNPHNARATSITITPEGRERIKEDPLLTVAAGLDALPEDECAQFLRTLETLSRARGPWGPGRIAS